MRHYFYFFSLFMAARVSIYPLPAADRITGFLHCSVYVLSEGDETPKDPQLDAEDDEQQVLAQLR